MSENGFTDLPSMKRKANRKKHTKSTLNKGIREAEKEERRYKSSSYRSKSKDGAETEWEKKEAATAKKNKLKDVKKVIESESGVVTGDMLEDPEIPTAARTDLANTPTLFQPLVNPETGRSPQTEFLEAGENEVLLSGGRGSGKSAALIAGLLRPEWTSNRDYKVLIIRRTMRELQDLISKAKIMCKDAIPGSRWRASENRIIMPSGAFLEFGYCETKDDVERYRGREFCILAIDELTMIPEEDMYIALISSVRTVDPDLPEQVLCTTNPYGVGFHWVKQRFINQGPEAETIVVSYKNDYTGTTHHTTRKWITSNFMDNPLIKDSYIASLAALPEEKRKRWLEGTWDGGDGMAFPEFNREKHVVKPFAIPHSWPRFRACDWGFGTRAATIWFALDPNGIVYAYREYCTTGVNADVYAREVLEREKKETVQYGVIDGSVGDKRGQALSVEQLMRREGCIWRYADKSQGSRLAGKMLFHQYLADDQLLEEPKFKIFDTCTETIDSLSTLPVDDKNPDDVDTKHKNDHAWDAIRFFILSRPKFTTSWSNPEYKQPPPVINSEFGY